MADQYSIPSETKLLFRTGILDNPLVQKDLPEGAIEAADHVSFVGSDAPTLPINWRFAESISALKAYEATILNVLLQRKYGIGPVDIKINTDHAQLFIVSCFIWTLDPEGDNSSASSILIPGGREKLERVFPDWDKGASQTSFYRMAVTNIYRTKDGRFFHLHGSMNPDVTIDSLGLPKQMEYGSLELASAPYSEAVAKYTAEEMQTKADGSKQAGTICWTTDEFKQSEHGRANSHIGLFEIDAKPNLTQKPCWWPSSPSTSHFRPLAGLKVVDLTRVIAAPTVTRGLAELGASVMRITAPHLPDLSVVHPDLNLGKWNACLDLRKEVDRQKLRDLVLEADVFVQGYRPGVLDKYGFSEQDIMEMCRGRDRGIIYCAENCYGWQGPWAHRSGWQQLSDANCGVSYEFGRAMGLDEPVTPVFPNSDYCTGVAGVTGILTALLRRAESGGSFSVKIALNYYSQWLVDSCGAYSSDVWQDVWQRSGSPVFRHYHPMQYSLPRVLEIIQKDAAQKLLRPEFFTRYKIPSVGKDVHVVAPVLQFPNGEVNPGFNVGTRTNGVDQPRWPDDLNTEVVL